MFRYEHPMFLWGLLAVPILLLFWWGYRRWRKKAWAALGDPDLLQRQIAQPNTVPPLWSLILLLSAISCLVVGLANPQWGQVEESAIQQRTDVWIALDISQSMNVNDLAPTRLERAKRLASGLAERLRSERIGLLYFACSAYIEMPLTNDWRAAQLLLQSANSDKAPTQGTALSAAIDLAQATTPDGGPGGVLVILSDGEDHDEQSEASAAAAVAAGWQLYTVGVGTREGGFIPRDARQNANEVLLDDNGQPFRSRLEEKGLRALSDLGGGAYFRLAERDAPVIEGLADQINRRQQQLEQSSAFSRPRSFFQLFLAIGLLLLLLERMLPALMQSTKS